MPSFLKSLAFAVSALSSPYLVVAVFGLLPIAKYAPDRETALLWDLIFIGSTVGIPFTYIAQLVLRKRVTDMHVGIREQRHFPILAAIIGGLSCFLLFELVHVPEQLSAMAATITVTGILFLAATQFAKASFHVGGFVGSVTISSLLVTPYLFLFLLAVPAIIWARSYRGRHTLAESLLGAGLSTIGTFSVFGLFSLL